MGHPRALLDLVAADVAKSWPASSGYRLEFERPLPGVRGMLPDIQVVDARGAVHCAVEIGYTRPEKLTYYRASGIADVRWYDKTGKLHGDVDRRVVVIEERPSHALIFKQFDVLYPVDCANCFEEYRRGACGAHLEAEDGCDCRPLQPLTADQEIDLDDEAREFFGSTQLTIISNGVRWLCLVLCDDCGDTFLLRDETDLWAATSLETAADFEKHFLAFKNGVFRAYVHHLDRTGGEMPPLNRLELTYEQVLELAKDGFELDITYADFVPWDEPAGARHRPAPTSHVAPRPGGRP